MDPTTTPDPEHVKWYTAVIGFFSAISLGLVAKLWNRHEKEIDAKDADFKSFVIESARRAAEFEQRLLQLEARDVASKEDIRVIVDEVVSGVIARFETQHGEIMVQQTEIVKQVHTCAAAINGRVDSLITSMVSIKLGGGL